MLTAPLRRCNHFRHINGVVAISNSNIGYIASGFESRRNYSKAKGCCPEVPQTAGKKVEPWPKPDPPPPAWRCECPKDPQPPNYDPYRIKVPDVVVPPIPASNAKWMGVVFTAGTPGKDTGPAAPQEPPAAHQQATDPGAVPEVAAEEEEEEAEPVAKTGEDEGFFARLGNLFGLGKSKKGEGNEVPTEDGREPKEAAIKLSSDLQDLFHDSPIVHPDYWKDKTKRALPAAVEGGVFPRLGYHGRSKYKYAFHEPWRPLDRVTLIAQAEKEETEMADVIVAAEKTDKQV